LPSHVFSSLRFFSGCISLHQFIDFLHVVVCNFQFSTCLPVTLVLFLVLLACCYVFPVQ
jgi:hypothetical protein